MAVMVLVDPPTGFASAVPDNFSGDGGWLVISAAEKEPLASGDITEGCNVLLFAAPSLFSFGGPDIRWSHDRHWRPFLSFSLPLHRHGPFQPHELSSQASPVMVTTVEKFNPMTHTFKVFRHRLPAMLLLPYHHFDCPYHQCIPTNSPRVCCRLLPKAQSHVNPAASLAGLAATDFTISPWLDLTADSTISVQML